MKWYVLWSLMFLVCLQKLLRSAVDFYLQGYAGEAATGYASNLYFLNRKYL